MTPGSISQPLVSTSVTVTGLQTRWRINKGKIIIQIPSFSSLRPSISLQFRYYSLMITTAIYHPDRHNICGSEIPKTGSQRGAFVDCGFCRTSTWWGAGEESENEKHTALWAWHWLGFKRGTEENGCWWAKVCQFYYINYDEISLFHKPFEPCCCC